MDAGVLPRDEAPFERFGVPEPFVKGRPTAPSLSPDAAIGPIEGVSLIVPTFFNRPLKAGAIDRLLAGLERSDAVREVILVCSDGTAGDAAEFVPPIRGKEVRVVAAEPGLRAQSRNLGAATASLDLLLFLDDDMIPPDWRLVDVLVSELLARGSDCALFPRRHYAKYPLLYDGEALDRFVSGWREGWESFDDPALIDPVKQGSPHRTAAFCFPGCFTLIRREAFDRIGGFPEGYAGWGFEDADFALRAVSRLRVWNLFWESPPLLHIDHPVSPYKTEEYYVNLKRFHDEYGTLRMDWLCRRAVSGEHFEPTRPGGPDGSLYLEPLRHAAEVCRLRLGDDLAASYRHFLEERMRLGRRPFPEQVVLHGSRAEGTATRESDFDLMVLFRDGTNSDFFAGSEEAGHRIEVEFAEAGKYQYIATQPVLHPLLGPMELAKVAKAVVLWGDLDTWESWRDTLLQTALRLGRAYWLLFALGMDLQPGKLRPLTGLFLSSLRAVMARADGERYRDDIALLAEGGREELAAHIVAVLDAEEPAWRRDVATGRRIFAQQVPAVWMALRWLHQRL